MAKATTRVFAAGVASLVVLSGIVWSRVGAAAPVQTVGIINASQAEIKATVPTSTNYQEDASKNFVKMFQTLPFVASVTEVSSGDGWKVIERSATQTKLQRVRFLMLKSQTPEMFPESLFEVTEEKVECIGGTSAQCSSWIESSFRGPKHAYQFHSQWLRPNVEKVSADGFETLKDSFEVTMSSSPADVTNPSKGINVVLKLDILSRVYMDYIRSLVRSKKLRNHSTELELQGAFVLWGQMALKQIFDS